MGSSMPTIGSGLPPLNSHRRLTQVTTRLVGALLLGGSRLNDDVVNLVPHHGHSSSGIGAGLERLLF